MKEFETNPDLSSLHVSKVTFFPSPPGRLEEGLPEIPVSTIFTIQAEFWIRGEVVLGPMTMSISPESNLSDVFEVGDEFIKSIETHIISKLMGTSKEPVTKLPGIGYGDD
jgi:hypothetical protein